MASVNTNNKHLWEILKLSFSLNTEHDGITHFNSVHNFKKNERLLNKCENGYVLACTSTFLIYR